MVESNPNTAQHGNKFRELTRPFCCHGRDRYVDPTTVPSSRKGGRTPAARSEISIGFDPFPHDCVHASFESVSLVKIILVPVTS